MKWLLALCRWPSTWRCRWLVMAILAMGLIVNIVLFHFTGMTIVSALLASALCLLLLWLNLLAADSEAKR